MVRLGMHFNLIEWTALSLPCSAELESKVNSHKHCGEVQRIAKHLPAMSKPIEQGPESIYDFTVKDAEGKNVNLSIYKGKVLLIVNVASKCGLTNSNYMELNQLYEKYKHQGLEILAFPCNQFGEEEPGSNEQILDFVCTRFKSEFPVFDKIEVNGENAAPLYKFLKSGKWGIFGDDIQWNFAKFLVDNNGKIVHRYYPTTSPLSIENDVMKLLGCNS